MTIEHRAQTASFDSTGSPENGGPSNDMILAGLDEKADSNFSLTAILSKGLAEPGNRNAFKKRLRNLSRLDEACRN